MNRLQCVGTSSKVPSQDAEAVKADLLCPRDAPVNKSVQPKKQVKLRTRNHEEPQKPKLSTRPEGQQPTVITERRPEKGNDVDGMTVDPEPVSETQNGQQENSFRKTNVQNRPSRSERHTGLQALSPPDMTMHRQEKSLRPSAAGGADEKIANAECMKTVLEPVVQLPRYLGMPQCGAERSTGEVGRGDEEDEDEGDEDEEEDEDTAEFCAPIELLAEFIKALMERKYTLAKKLCQMILIYEPDNPEAKHFLPLIEERLVIEESQEGSSSEDNTSDADADESSSSSSDDDDDEEEEEEEEEDEHEGDDTDTGTDSDGESSDSCSSSSDRKEEDISQH